MSDLFGPVLIIIGIVFVPLDHPFRLLGLDRRSDGQFLLVLRGVAKEVGPQIAHLAVIFQFLENPDLSLEDRLD